MEILKYSFVQHAIVTGFLICIISGLLSFFIVMRKLSFLSVGISHSALAGIALGFILNFNPFVTTFIFCIITGFFIGKLTRMGNIEYDTSIGIFFAFTMALAIFLIYISGIQINIMTYLFGSIIGVSKSDMILSVCVTVLFLIFYFLFFKEFIFITFDEDVAKVSGVNVELFDSFFLIILSAIIVICIKLVGIILTSAFLILPATFGMNVSKNYKIIIPVSVIFSILTFFIGFLISYFYDIPVGATIVVVQTLIYFISIPISSKII